MPRRRPTLLLWLTLLACAPVPFFLVESGRQPAVALLQMLGVTLLLIATEGSGGAAPLVAAMLGAQVLVAGLVFSVFASLAARGLVRVAGERASAAAFALAVLMVVVALVVPLYRTPFRSGGLEATLAQVFE